MKYKKQKSVFIAGLTIILLIVTGLFICFNFFFGKYINETILANNFEVTTDSKEIDIKNLVKIEKEINYISILLEPSYKTVTNKEFKGIKILGGEIINPEIRVIDENGKEYSLAYSGSRHFDDYEYANYKYAGELPVDKKYEKVLIKSNAPIKAQKIIWASYNARDLK